MTDRLHHVFVDQTSEPFRHRTVSAGVLQRGEEGGELRGYWQKMQTDTLCFQGHQFLSFESGPRFTPTLNRKASLR